MRYALLLVLAVHGYGQCGACASVPFVPGDTSWAPTFREAKR